MFFDIFELIPLGDRYFALLIYNDEVWFECEFGELLIFGAAWFNLMLCLLDYRLGDYFEVEYLFR